MARNKILVTKTDGSEPYKYKTAEAEERAILRRLRAHHAKREKEMEGMTNQEKADYMNRLGEEAMAKMGITKFTKQRGMKLQN